jgi:hypothetical protein
MLFLVVLPQAPDVLEGLEEVKTQRGWRIGLSLSGEWPG